MPIPGLETGVVIFGVQLWVQRRGQVEAVMQCQPHGEWITHDHRRIRRRESQDVELQLLRRRMGSGKDTLDE